MKFLEKIVMKFEFLIYKIWFNRWDKKIINNPALFKIFSAHINNWNKEKSASNWAKELIRETTSTLNERRTLHIREKEILNMLQGHTPEQKYDQLLYLRRICDIYSANNVTTSFDLIMDNKIYFHLLERYKREQKI